MSNDVFDGAPITGAPLSLNESGLVSTATRAISRRQLWLASLATALLWWLSLAWPWAWLAGWFAPAPLLWMARRLSGRARGWFAWKCGVVCFALINWWIVPCVAYGAPMIGLPSLVGALLGTIAVAGIACIHALQVLAAVMVWSWARERGGRRVWAPIAFAVAWTLGEWVRTQTVMAHGWGALAFSQWRDLPLLQSVAWLGQHGLSGVLAWTAAATVAAFDGENDEAKSTRKYLCLPSLVLLLLHLGGAWRLAHEPINSPDVARVLLVQTDVGSGDKNSESGGSALTQALRMTQTTWESSPAEEKPQLIVWPETTLSLNATNFDSDAHLSGLNAVLLRDLAKHTNASLLVGASTTQTNRDGRRVLRNDAVLIAPNGKMQRRGKTRPVPFGERALFGEYLPFLNALAPDPPVEIAPSEGPMSLELGGKTVQIGTAICFESDFPEPARGNSRGAQLLAIISNDEWFKGTEAPREHAAMAIVRAVENRVSLVQAANGGHSFAADKCGRVIIPSFTAPVAPLLPSHMTHFGRVQSVFVRVPLP